MTDVVYIKTEASVACPQCGAPTVWEVLDHQELHLCCNDECNYSFVVEDA